MKNKHKQLLKKPKYLLSSLEVGIIKNRHISKLRRYIKKASELVGEKGIVYAVDIHELAIESVNRKIKKFKLKNVIPVVTIGYTCDIESEKVDLIYALDMFHMIKDPTPFLTELHRLLKKGGILILEDGHQSRENSKKKIENSNLWDILEEKSTYIKCNPKK